ncbi:MAG: tetratricopeptide repeat protein [Chlamydiales bacterium]
MSIPSIPSINQALGTGLSDTNESNNVVSGVGQAALSQQSGRPPVRRSLFAELYQAKNEEAERTENLKGALKQFNKVVKENPESPEAIHLLGEAFAQTKDFSNARDLFRISHTLESSQSEGIREMFMKLQEMDSRS